MSIESKKLELIHWISELRDSKVLNYLSTFKKKVESKSTEERSFGSGKDITFIADDFNDTLDDFRGYTK